MSLAIPIFLVLGMHKLLMLLMPLALMACNSEPGNEDTILTQPPFDKITDSIHQSLQNPDLYYHRGVLLFQNNEPVYAEKDIRKAWDLMPREEYALSMTTILKQKNPDSAISFLQTAIQKFPSSIALQIGLARGYQSKGQLDKAIEIIDRILDQYPGQLDALVLKSEILKAQNKNEEAIATLSKAHSYSPGDVELAHQLAFEYAEAKDSKVLALSDSLIKADVDGHHAEPYYFKGLYFSNTGKLVEAINYFDEAIRHDYNFLDAYMDKGQVLFNQKKNATALKTFQLVTTINPSFADAYYWIGKTEQAAGNKEEAKLNYQRAYGLDKSLTEAKEAADKL
jgi:tetratricopeptide (TPR) repeat protein